MIPFFENMRYMTPENVPWVTLLRLGVALLCGGIIGLERGRKRRPAGFRTHMLVCLGAALAMVMSQYLSVMEAAYWSKIVPFTANTDLSRFGAQVINGIGFLGAGTIIVTGKQEVKGLTTAAGLWASACMGLAVGAGFVEGALVGCLLISITIILFTRLEHWLMIRARNINLFIEFENSEDLGAIISSIKEQDVRIFDVEIQKEKKEQGVRGAVFSIRLPKRMRHTGFIATLAGVECIRSIEEL